MVCLRHPPVSCDISPCSRTVAWYEWYPDYAYDFTGISIKAGDTIKLTVTASTPFTGSAVIQNLSNGEEVTKAIVSLSALCEENAEWIVEDYEEGSSLVPFANFGTVEFTVSRLWLGSTQN